MNNGQKSLSINETFIIESLDDLQILSACTGFYTNTIISCSGDSVIHMGTGIISTPSEFSATTYYGDGSNLTGISTQDTFVTGGTYNTITGVATFTNNTGGTFSITGFYTGATDVYVTGVTFTNNLLTLYRNDGVSFGATIDNFVSLNVNGPISATTYYGDGSNLTGISTQDTVVTGGTYSNGTAIFTNNTGGTFSVSGFSTGYTLTSSAITNTLGYTPLSAYTDTFITGGTYSDGTTVFANNTGGTFNVSGYFTPNDDVYISGVTFDVSNYDLILKRNDGVNFTQNLGVLSSDVTITGGTYNPNNGVATFTNNTGGTFQVSGFITGFTDVYITGGTFNNDILRLDRTDNNFVNISISNFNNIKTNTISATTYQNLPIDVRVTGATKSGTVATFTNNTGGTFTLTGLTDTFITGATKSGTVATFTNNTGGTFTLTGLTDVFVTGGTKSGTVATFTNNTGGTFTLTGLTDTFITGGTYSSGTTVFRNNTGGTFNVSGYFTPNDDVYVTNGQVYHGPQNNDSNKITLQRNNASDININNFINISEVDKVDMDSVLIKKQVIRDKTYKIKNCDSQLYFNGTDSNNQNIYTTIYLTGVEYDKLSEKGIGVFYTPKYEIYSIFDKERYYYDGDFVIWGGLIWRCIRDGIYKSVNDFTLSNDFVKIYPFDGSDSYLNEFYNINYDEIIYDYGSDSIIYRNEQNTNIVSSNIESNEYWLSIYGYSPIKVFKWGNVYNRDTEIGIGNQSIINSYNNNINYNGKYQTNFYFNNLSYQINLISDNNSYQNNFHFDNGSYQDLITLNNNSYQNNLSFINQSYQRNININNSRQYSISFNNGNQVDMNLFSYKQLNIYIENGSQVNGLTNDQDTITIKGYGLDLSTYPTIVDNKQFIIHDLPSTTPNKLIGKINNQFVEVSNLEFNGVNWVFNNDVAVPTLYGATISATTYQNLPLDINITGGTYSNGTAVFANNTGGTFSVSGFSTGYTLTSSGISTALGYTPLSAYTDTFTTGGTYSGSSIIFTNNTGGTFSVTGITTSSAFTGGTVTGATQFTAGLTSTTISATTIISPSISTYGLIVATSYGYQNLF